MTNQAMFFEAHVQARADRKAFGGSYQVRFANALRGFQAVQRGFRGVQVIEPARVWA